MAIVDRPTDLYLDKETGEVETPILCESDFREHLERPEVAERIARVEALVEERRQPDERSRV